jgi:hypothetical protein
MKFNENDIISYIDSQKSYQVFNIDYTQKEINSIKNFNIEKFGDYNSYNTLNNLEQFIKNIGKNSSDDIATIIDIIKKLLDTILKSYNTNSYWISIRIHSKTTFFDIPRWHCDGFYHSHRNKLQTKFITTLKGPTTLVLETTKEEKDYFYKLQEYKDKSILDESELDIEKRKYISENIRGKKINLSNNNGVIFVAGDKDKCLIHSEPKHEDNRFFISILPATKEEINEFAERSKNASKNFDKFNKFYKAFKYPISFLNKEDKNYDERYQLKNIIIMVFNKNMKKEHINIKYFDFPKNILEVYWYEEGENNVRPWQFIGKVRYKNKFKYVYYIADSDYTGFDCVNSDMKLYVSKSLNRLLRKAIPSDLIKKNKEIQELKI